MFKTYLTKTGQTKRSFAKRIGISENYLSEISRFVRQPSLDVAYKIWLATDGQIPMQYWVEEGRAGLEASHIAKSKSSKGTTSHA